MVKVEVSVKGIAPLLMNKFIEVQSTESKRGKKVYVPEEEAEKKTYRTSEDKLFLPNTHFKASMIKASTDFKMSGRKSYKDYVKISDYLEKIIDRSLKDNKSNEQLLKEIFGVRSK